MFLPLCMIHISILRCSNIDYCHIIVGTSVIEQTEKNVMYSTRGSKSVEREIARELRFGGSKSQRELN